MNRPKQVIDIYKYQRDKFGMFPSSIGYDFWDDTYGASITEPGQGSFEVYDREFARRFASFEYYDFLDGETIAEVAQNFKDDVRSILIINAKRYEEMYRVFLVEDEDDPITYNYDLTETTGAQHTSSVKGEQLNTTGAQENTTGAQTDTHNVAPYNTSTLTAESSDVSGNRTDNFGQRVDTDGARTDTYDSNAWTLTRKGNIGVQTAGDILRIHTQYWTETYKFFNLIFDDIAKQLLMVGD